MNYLKVNKERFNLTLQDIETETGIHISKLSHLQNSPDFENRCRYSDFVKLRDLFTELAGLRNVDPIFSQSDQQFIQSLTL